MPKNKSQSKKLKKINKNPFKVIKKNITSYLNRRPHRSFRNTRRRDYIRGLQLPGYLKFTKYVWHTIWVNRKIFFLLALTYAILTALIVGMASQDTYSSITDTMADTGGNLTGFWGGLGKAGLIFISTATGGLNGSLSESQQIFGGLIMLMTWLASIWLLRNILAGHKVKLRDGLYNSGSPILPTFLVALLFMVQLLPVALALIGYGAASVTGLLDGGVEAMLFWFAAGLLTMISLYFITSTVFALIIITLPGMYPFKAIKIAGDLVIGRRIRILLRFLWVLILTALVWAIIMIPMILFDGWIKSLWPAINWLPMIPLFLLGLGALTVIWVSSYVYLLYRKVVSDESSPA